MLAAVDIVRVNAHERVRIPLVGRKRGVGEPGVNEQGREDREEEVAVEEAESDERAKNGDNSVAVEVKELDVLLQDLQSEFSMSC